MMSKAKVFIELEIDINKTDYPNDKSLDLSEIADTACGGIYYTIQNAIDKNKRKAKITSARYEYTISKKCKYTITSYCHYR
jgi:hypothetical protein